MIIKKKMTTSIKHKLIIFAMNIALSFCLEFKTTKFKPFSYNNTKDLKFSSDMNLIESYITNDQAFNHMKCIAKSSKNSLTQAISYQVDQYSSKTCKAYSNSNIQPSDIALSSQSMIFYRYQISYNYNCKIKIIIF